MKTNTKRVPPSVRASALITQALAFHRERQLAPTNEALFDAAEDLIDEAWEAAESVVGRWGLDRLDKLFRWTEKRTEREEILADLLPILEVSRSIRNRVSG